MDGLGEISVRRWVEEVEVVADRADGLAVGELLERDGPVGSPHQTVAAEGVVEAFHLGVCVAVGVGLRGERPHVRDFDEDVWVAGEGQQQLELIGPVERAVGHVIDDDGELWVLLDERDEVG